MLQELESDKKTIKLVFLFAGDKWLDYSKDIFLLTGVQ